MKKAITIIKKNKTPILIGGGVIVAFFGYKKVKGEIDRRKLLKDIKDFKKGDKASINSREVARQLGMDFGFEYPVADPRHWTENDSAIRDLLLTIPVTVMPSVEKEYVNLYKRSLQKDAQKYLPDSDYKKVSYLFTGIEKTSQDLIDQQKEIIKSFDPFSWFK